MVAVFLGLPSQGFRIYPDDILISSQPSFRLVFLRLLHPHRAQFWAATSTCSVIKTFRHPGNFRTPKVTGWSAFSGWKCVKVAIFIGFSPIFRPITPWTKSWPIPKATFALWVSGSSAPVAGAGGCGVFFWACHGNWPGLVLKRFARHSWIFMANMVFNKPFRRESQHPWWVGQN